MNLHRTTVVGVVSLVAFVLALQSCAERRDIEQDLSVAVKLFHERYNDEDIGSLHRDASSAYHTYTGRTASAKRFRSLSRQYGDVLSTTKVHQIVGESSGSPTISAMYTTMFERGFATEYFSFRYAAGGARLELVAYDLQP